MSVFEDKMECNNNAKYWENSANKWKISVIDSFFIETKSKGYSQANLGDVIPKQNIKFSYASPIPQIEESKSAFDNINYGASEDNVISRRDDTGMGFDQLMSSVFSEFAIFFDVYSIMKSVILINKTVYKSFTIKIIKDILYYNFDFDRNILNNINDNVNAMEFLNNVLKYKYNGIILFPKNMKSGMWQLRSLLNDDNINISNLSFDYKNNNIISQKHVDQGSDKFISFMITESLMNNNQISLKIYKQLILTLLYREYNNNKLRKPRFTLNDILSWKIFVYTISMELNPDKFIYLYDIILDALLLCGKECFNFEILWQAFVFRLINDKINTDSQINRIILFLISFSKKLTTKIDKKRRKCYNIIYNELIHYKLFMKRSALANAFLSYFVM